MFSSSIIIELFPWNTVEMAGGYIYVTELELDRTTSMPKSVLRFFGGKGSGASIWYWASTTLVLPNEMTAKS